MASGELEFVIKANSDDFTKGIKAAADQTNRLTRQMERASKVGGWRNEQASAAREARKAAFDRLSVEERIERTKQRQVRLEQALAKAQAGGNIYRAAALGAAAARNRNLLSGMSGSGGGGGVGAFMSGALGRIGLGGGMLGALGAGGVAMGAVLGTVNMMRWALNTANELGDIGEQFGISRTAAFGLETAASRAGVRRDAVYRGLGTLAQARSAALAGDPTATATFARYGIGSEQLQNQNNIVALAQAIRQSLGAGGMQGNDVGDLSRLLGGRPGRMLAVLREFQDPTEMEQSLGNLDDVQTQWETALTKIKKTLLNVMGTIAYFLNDGWRQVLMAAGISMPGPAAAIMAGVALGSDGASNNPVGNDVTGPRAASTTAVPAGGAASAVSGGTFDPTHAARPEADALAKIGLFRGGFDPANAIRQKQLDTLQRIERIVATMQRTQGYSQALGEAWDQPLVM